MNWGICPELKHEKQQSGYKDNGRRCKQGDLKRVHIIHPSYKWGDSRKHKSDYEVPYGENRGTHFRKCHLIDIAFQDRGGESAEDIKDKKINLVIVKDLSRLGRDHVMTGYYIETYFPV